MVSCVNVHFHGPDIGGCVADAQRAVTGQVRMPPG
jgi:Cu/Ag efflux pump CusA